MLVCISNCSETETQTKTYEEQAEDNQLAFYKLDDPDCLSCIPSDPKNPITESGVALGLQLSKTNGLGREFTCQSCHFAHLSGFAPDKQGIGRGGVTFFDDMGHPVSRIPLEGVTNIDVQPVRTPSLANVGYFKFMLANDGLGHGELNKKASPLWGDKIFNHLGFTGLETQAFVAQSESIHGIVINDDAMRADNPNLIPLFNAAFPDILPANQRCNKVTGGLAMAQWERTLITYNAPFQKYIRGEADLPPDQKRGMELFFFDEGLNCVSCHSNPALGSDRQYAMGFDDLIGIKADGTSMANSGRYEITKRESDMYKFSTPGLYQLKDAENKSGLGHGGSFNTIDECVEAHIYGIVQKEETKIFVDDYMQDGKARKSVYTKQDIKDISSFIRHALYDSTLQERF